jgi:hypothetical protein
VKSLKGKATLIYDNEPRNKEIMNLMEVAIKDGHQVVIWPSEIIYKDINEMIKNGVNVLDIISKNIYSGLEGLLHFYNWKRC